MPAHLHPVEPEELMAYADAELSADRAAGVAAHLEQCGECQALLADLRNVVARIQEWRVVAPSFALPVREFRPRGWLRPWGWGAAAAAMLITGLVITSRTSRLSMGLRQMPETARRSIEADAPVPAPPPPLIARSATLVLAAVNPDLARAAIEAILLKHHGYIAQMTVTAPAASAQSMDASLKIPAPELERTLDELTAMGRVESETRAGEEVTAQSVDLDARLNNARNTERRLTELLQQRTGSLADVLAVENQIDTTRGEIERMEAERKSLDTRIAFATIDLHVAGIYKAGIAGAGGPVAARLRNAAVEGCARLTASFLAVSTWLLAEGPFAVAWCALLFFPGRGAWRRLKRSRERPVRSRAQI